MTFKRVEKKTASAELRLSDTARRSWSFAEWEKRTEKIVEEKVYEIRMIAYILLLISTALLALVLGMVLNALGFKL